METKKSIGFGARGWLLIVVLFTSFMMFQVFTNFPLNILADFYGGSTKVAPIMSIGTFIGIVLQVIISSFVGKIKSIKKVAAWIGLVALICCVAVAAIPVTMGETGPGVSNFVLWYAAYLLVNVCSTMYALFFLSIIAGQWFPTRKGTVMGIATIAYPVCNGAIGFFAAIATKAYQGDTGKVFTAYLPFIIICAIGYVLFLLFVTDYPEQVGAYRDNDKGLTPDVAKKMMEEEIENKKTTVWYTGHTFMCRDFWFAAITCGLILMAAIGVMTQSNTIIKAVDAFNSDAGYQKVMMIVAIFGAVGSWLLGVIDTHIGTKKAMIISTVLLIIAGIFGAIAVNGDVPALLIIAMIFIAMSMGASSNFTVSVAAQYWRREDFQSVFACVNPIANIFNALAAVAVAFILNMTTDANGAANNVAGVFVFVCILGVVGTIIMACFSAKHVKDTDDAYRKEAGKALDDALANRK